MEEILRYKIHISGRVQGVGFRWSAVKEACSIGINGFVQNLSDGRVYIEAEGTSDQLNILVDWCKKSPGLSVVDSVNVDPSSPVNHTEFRII